METTFPEQEIGKKPKIAEYKGLHSLIEHLKWYNMYKILV